MRRKQEQLPCPIKGSYHHMDLTKLTARACSTASLRAGFPALPKSHDHMNAQRKSSQKGRAEQHMQISFKILANIHEMVLKF